MFTFLHPKGITKNYGQYMVHYLEASTLNVEAVYGALVGLNAENLFKTHLFQVEWLAEDSFRYILKRYKKLTACFLPKYLLVASFMISCLVVFFTEILASSSQAVDIKI